jgi:hypothetical protein
MSNPPPAFLTRRHLLAAGATLSATVLAANLKGNVVFGDESGTDIVSRCSFRKIR